MSQVKTRNVTVPVSDGTQMSAYLAIPEHKGQMPAVIVLQEIFGLTHHIKEVTKRVAALGYFALAPELFHRAAPGFHASYDDLPAGMAQAKQLTLPQIEADLRATFDFVNSDPHVKKDHVATLGFCMGGRFGFLANSLLPLRAVVSYYGGGIASQFLDRVPDQHGPLLAIWGGRDKHVTLEQIRQLEDAMHLRGKSFVNAVFHDAGHGFNCDERADFHHPSAEQAWALTTAFLHAHLSDAVA